MTTQSLALAGPNAKFSSRTLTRTLSLGIVLGLAAFVALAGNGSLRAASFEVEPTISAGIGHTCVLLDVGGVTCWGLNSFGQLGNGTTTSTSTSGGVNGLASGVSGLSAGGNHTCALLDTGGVSCWGQNTQGQLGDGTLLNRDEPVGVSGLAAGVVAISAGDAHTCALLDTGAVKCWGHNLWGQLGDATNVRRTSPVDVSGLSSGIVSLGVGGFHSCAVTAAGGVKCWGRNDFGQLGLGAGIFTNTNVPADVSGLSVFAATVSADRYHTCAAADAGGANCWGRNDFGQLGDGTNASSQVAVGVSGIAIGTRQITIGEFHSCAVLVAGPPLCWGRNTTFGQLGDGAFSDSSTPVSVSSLTSAAVYGIATGKNHTCGLTDTGGASCWGRNSSGQLGNGTTTGSPTPVAVTSIVVITCEGLAPTIAGTPGVDVINGTSGNDVILTYSGNDIVHGLDGDDLICGGRGRDTLYGDIGEDVVYGDKHDDFVDGGEGNDYMYGGGGNDDMYGQGGHDRIDGMPGDDYIEGGIGNDYVYASSGEDEAYGGPGNDRLYGAPGNDYLNGGPGTDKLQGGLGDDTMLGEGGPDEFICDGGVDSADGGIDVQVDTADVDCESVVNVP